MKIVKVVLVQQYEGRRGISLINRIRTGPQAPTHVSRPTIGLGQRRKPLFVLVLIS